MAAAEIGFKQCVATLIPAAEWLAHNIPSPPLDKMLSDYLPLLPAKLPIQGKVLKPVRRIRKAIEKGLKARNSTAHKGTGPPGLHDLEEILLSIRDPLYLLDGYSGFAWAFDNIRHETREEMFEEFRLKKK